jgi:uncharacterized protein involved in exopolysaccharide biosynthesis
MNKNQNNARYNKDEIDFRELIMALWKRKRFIIGFTLISAILAGMFSKFVLSPVYDTKLNIVISMPEKYNTRYGEYTLPITSNDQYINLITSNDVLINTMEDMVYNLDDVSIERLRKRIYIGRVEAKQGTIQNSFDVNVSADDPEESLKLAQTLFSNYLDFMDAMIKERVVGYYSNYFNVDLKKLEKDLDRAKETLKKNEELLAQTSQIIAAGNANLEIQTQLNESSDYVIPVDSVNPNYIKIENDIVGNKQYINSIENSMRMYKGYLEELDIERQAINKYYRTGEAEKLESSIIGIVETSVYLPSSPVAPTEKTSPSNTLNTIIGAVLGGLSGVMVVLFQEYLFKRVKN